MVTYFEHWFPLAPPTYDAVLSLVPDDDELAFLAHAFAALPPATTTDVDGLLARHRDKEVLKRQLAACANVAAVDDAVARLEHADVDALDCAPRAPELPARLLAHRRPPRSSTTAGSSTSRPSPASAWRTSSSSRTRTPWCCSGS